jgi:hypothetical protein
LRKANPKDLLQIKRRKAIPHEFVLDAIASLKPWTRTMFGCLAVYVGEKIVLILRDKAGDAVDNGVWLATTGEHHESLRREFPNMRSIRVLGKEVTGWQVLPADAADFEEAALRACELIEAGGHSDRQGAEGKASPESIYLTIRESAQPAASTSSAASGMALKTICRFAASTGLSTAWSRGFKSISGSTSARNLRSA